MSGVTHIGAHELSGEGDLVRVRFYGAISLSESRELLTVFERVLEEHGRLYILFDNRNAPAIDPAARRLFVEWTQHHMISGVANFGGGVMQRTMALLLMNAIRLFTKRAPPQTYAATEAEARAWVTAQRRLDRPGAAT